jgi:cytidylate kinase
MQGQPGFEQCLRFVHSESSAAAVIFGQPAQPRLTITLSRQSGCGAREVAGHLARFLQEQTACNPPWTVFDDDLVEKVLEEHKLPAQFARYLAEDGLFDLAHALDELIGAHPSFWTLARQTSETISRLAERGNAILVGRGAHVVAGGRDHIFHVRLVCSLPRRVAHLKQIRSIDKEEAIAAIQREDRGRRRYLKKYFGKDIDDPLSYHLVVNTDFVPYERAARLIGEAALENFRTVQSRERLNVS